LGGQGVLCVCVCVCVCKILLERESVCTRVREWGTSRRRGRESQVESVLSVEPDAGLDLTTLGSRPELKSGVGCLID